MQVELRGKSAIGCGRRSKLDRATATLVTLLRRLRREHPEIKDPVQLVAFDEALAARARMNKLTQ